MKLIQQKTDWDCVHACLAMWLDVSYEDILKAADEIHLPHVGLSVEQTRVLGKQFDMDIAQIHTSCGNPTGILSFPSLNFHSLFHQSTSPFHL